MAEHGRAVFLNLSVVVTGDGLAIDVAFVSLL
jgi:hypothetical protein